jgi:tetratricopeptide (TPR) repeat protein
MPITVERAVQLCGEQRYEEALSELDSLLNTSLSDVDRIEIAGNKVNVLMHMGRYGDAEILAGSLLSSVPADSLQALNLRHQISVVREHEGRFSEAAEEYAAILTKEYSNGFTSEQSWFFDFIRLQYGICLAKLKQFGPALEQLQAVRRPDEMPASWITERHYYLGLCFFDLRNFSQASMSLTNVIEAGNSELLAKALYYLVQAERENGRSSVAVEALTRLAKMEQTVVPAEYIQKLLAQLGANGQYEM